LVDVTTVDAIETDVAAIIDDVAEMEDVK